MSKFKIKNSLQSLFSQSEKDVKNPQKISLDFHKQSLDQLASFFNTSLSDGLSESEAKQLLTKNGENILKHHTKNVLLKMLSYLFTGFCGLLWLGSIVSILSWKPIGNPPDPTNLGMGILLIVVIFLQV